jgi:uncharacterized protein YPO0396
VDKLEAATVKFEARIDAIGMETASLRHLAESLERERDAARAELKSVKDAHGQLAHYGVAARHEALAAHHHLSRFLGWAQPPLPTTGGDSK